MDKKIDNILARILGGEGSSDDFLQFGNWLNEDSKNREIFLRLKNYWDAEVSFNHSISPVDSLAKTQKEIRKRKMRNRRKAIVKVIIPVAAVIFLIITLSIIYKAHKVNDPVEYFTYVTTKNKIDFTLNDESKITLNKNSRFTYSNKYGISDRNIQLEGEAYFEIKKDPSRQFVVAVQAGANPVFIKVLGTTFNLKLDKEKEQVIATLAEGSIQFENAEQTIMIFPNQELTYHYSTNDISIKEVIVEDHTLWKSGLIKYKTVSFLYLVTELEKIFKVKIIIQNKHLENPEVTVTGTFSEEQTLEEILTVVSRSLPFEWTRDNGVYYIN